MSQNPTPLGFAPHDHSSCIASALARAESDCAARQLHFTPVRRRALEILLETHAALGAYDVLGRLAADGFGSKPPLAYRALGFLVDHGFAHRVERLNAYIACALPDADHDPAFLICRSCGHVAEATNDTPIGTDSGFAIETTVVEAEGLCPACQD